MRLLLIEDNPDHATLVGMSLKRSLEHVEVVLVETLAAGMAALRADRFDAVLLDLSLPDSQGPAGVATLERAGSGVPVVVLTSLDDESTAMAALESGAQDYLVKDKLSGKALTHALRYAAHRHQAIMENRRLVGELCEARGLLERKNRRLRKLYRQAQRFVDNVSHEFRTPLTVIREYASLIRDGIVGAVSTEQDRMLSVVEDRADDLNTMVDDMLDVSKLHAGVMGIHRRSCRPIDIIEHARPGLARKAATRGVKFTIDVDTSLPEVFCDDEKAGRVVTNLTVNALKFCREGGNVRLWARLDDGGGQIVFGVTDDGPGIGKEGLARLFRRFKESTSRALGESKGFGLGLNIARELTHLNFGEIAVESEVGRGSTFSFTVPLANSPEIVRRFLDRQSRSRNGATMLSLVMARVGDDVDARMADDAGSFLTYTLRPEDLVFRADGRSWLIVTGVDHMECRKLLNRVEKGRKDANRNRPAGPLPEIEVSVVATFPVCGKRAAILENVERILGWQGVLHAGTN